MKDDTQDAVRTYLARLDTALAQVEPEVRTEIVAGIREELDGLEGADATSRISELGDPAFIAAEAMAALPVRETTGPPPGRTLAIIAVMLVIVGSFVIPIIGPMVGLVWISISRTFSRREKVVAWLAPLATGVILALVVSLVTMAGQAAGEAVNPALPIGALSGWHLAILVTYVLLPVTGIVLFVRAHRRGWRPMPSITSVSSRA